MKFQFYDDPERCTEIDSISCHNVAQPYIRTGPALIVPSWHPSALLASALLFLLGATLASFLALVADRWPRGEAFAGGRSRCRSCDTILRARDLVPVASWLVLRGRCGRCRAAIPADLIVAEIAGGSIAIAIPGAAAAVGGGIAGALALAVFAAGLLLLALIDARHLWLPDRLTLPLILGGLAGNIVLPLPDSAARAYGAAAGWLALSAVSAAYRRLRHREGLGAGDAKLLAAIGAWLGIAALPMVVLGAAAIGLAWALALRLAGRQVTGDMALPFGTMLAIAALVLGLVFPAGI